MTDLIVVYTTRVILTGIAFYGLYLVWTKEVSILKWVNDIVNSSLPIDDSKDLQLEKVNLSICANRQGALSLFIDIDEEIDKIQDIKLYITTKNNNGFSGRVGLMTIREFKYYYDLMLEPYSTIDYIDQRILEYQRWTNAGDEGIDYSKVNLESFSGDELFMEWRDAENKKHVKKWPYERYSYVVSGLKKGFLKLENTNIYVCQMTL